MDLRTGSRLAAIGALLAGAWFFVRMLKPKEGELQTLDSRSAEFGDMSSAASRRPAGGDEGDVSGLDMVPTSSLPLAGPDQPPEPEPPRPDPPAEPAPPAPPEPYQPPPPARKPRAPIPRLQKVESDLGAQAATSSAFLPNPEEAAKEDEKKKKKK